MAYQLIYDGSFEGLLSAVFHVYAAKLPPEAVGISAQMQAQSGDLFAQSIWIASNAEQAERVFKRLQQQLHRGADRQLLYGFLYAHPTMADTFLRLVRQALTHPQRGFFADKGNPDVLQWGKWAQAVSKEKHRMEAFVRFEAHDNEVFFAGIAPDYDILALIAPHFRRRYPQMRWAIYDRRRAYGIYHEDGRLMLLDTLLEQARKTQLSETEAHYQALWRQYFKSTTIDNRRNTALQARQMPRRYWRYLTELQP